MKQMDELEREREMRTTATEEEFENFMQRVTEIEHIVKGMASKNPQEAAKATRKAEILLVDKSGRDITEDGCTVKVNKTSINQAKSARPSQPGDEDQMNPEVFMAHMEKDAKRRAQDRRERKEISDRHKLAGNKAFREKNYEEALASYNQAIEQVKDSAVLYTNRALTLLHLRLYSRAASDCEWTLKVDESNLKAWLYKAKAHHHLGEEEEAKRCLREAIERHPNHESFIKDFRSQWESTENSDDDD